MNRFRNLISLQLLSFSVFAINALSLNPHPAALNPNDLQSHHVRSSITDDTLSSDSGTRLISDDGRRRNRERLETPDEFLTQMNSLEEVLPPDSATLAAYKDARSSMAAHPEGHEATKDFAKQWLQKERDAWQGRKYSTEPGTSSLDSSPPLVRKSSSCSD